MHGPASPAVAATVTIAGSTAVPTAAHAESGANSGGILAVPLPQGLQVLVRLLARGQGRLPDLGGLRASG
ncbi:hypothetical protein [Desulfobulbus propionicus]